MNTLVGKEKTSFLVYFILHSIKVGVALENHFSNLPIR